MEDVNRGIPKAAMIPNLYCKDQFGVSKKCYVCEQLHMVVSFPFHFLSARKLKMTTDNSFCIHAEVQISFLLSQVVLLVCKAPCLLLNRTNNIATLQAVNYASPVVWSRPVI